MAVRQERRKEGGMKKKETLPLRSILHDETVQMLLHLFVPIQAFFYQSVLPPHTGCDVIIENTSH